MNKQLFNDCMPSRRDKFVNGNFYHIFNKTIDHKTVFINQGISQLFLELVRYYRSQKADIRYSYFLRLDPEFKATKEKKLANEKYFKVHILAYCLMPNHFHLLLKQLSDKGIIRSVADILNSLTRSFNVYHDRQGPLFLPQFRSQRIFNREQLIHVSRYIHLNPYSSGLVNSLEDLEKYPYSSLCEYLGNVKNPLCNTQIILSEFVGGKDAYRKFIFNNADYQRSLEYIKHSEKWL